MVSAPIIGEVLFPVGFCMLYLLGFDLLAGVFVLSPLALLDKRPGVTVPGKVIAMWMPILVFFYMVFEHSVVNMFLFPSGLMHQLMR